MTSVSDAEFVDIDWARPPGSHRIRVGRRASATRPLVVFLHEGLGSVAMWKDFPQRFCARHGRARARVSRATATAARRRGRPTSAGRRLHAPAGARGAAGAARRARHRRAPWLFGHSDGGSIALLHAARLPTAAGVVVARAAHLRRGHVGREHRKAREAYRTPTCAQRLARYHDDPDSAFCGWNDIWLDPAFRAWNIEARASRSITLPGARGAGRRRRVRHARADPRHRAAIAANPLARDARTADTRRTATSPSAHRARPAGFILDTLRVQT